MIKKLLCLSIIILAVAVTYADQTSDIYFHRGIQKYLKKNLDGAISDVEKAVSMGATEKKVTAFLVKMLVERGTVLYKNKQYEDALPYFERAKGYDPENKEIQSVIAITQEKLKPQTVMSGGVTVERVTLQDTFTLELLKSVQNQQDKLIEAVTKPNDMVREILKRSDAERRELMTMMDKKNDMIVAAVKSEKDSVKSMVVYGLIGFIVTVIIIVWLIYMISVKTSLKREAMMLKQQEAILGIVYQQQVALSQGNSMLRLSDGGVTTTPGTVTSKVMLNDANPRIRAKGIEIIDAELVKDKEDPAIAEKMIGEFLNDKNNRVRANAAKALYKYSPEKALRVIQDMLDSGDKWMRVSAIWVLGELHGDEKAAQMLLDNLGDKDQHLSKRLTRSCYNLLDNDTKLPPDMHKKIKKAVESLPKEEEKSKE